MKAVTTLAALALGCTVSSSALAACSEAPIRHNWAVQAGDQRVTGDFVRQTVLGHKVRFEGAYEDYKKNGGYVFKDGNGNTYNPDGYVFYADGTRCLNYPEPRYDLYVVRDQKLVLINRLGERFTARLTK